jgi:hypothetical protein
MLSGNIVSLTPMRKPIIQKSKKWPGQNHELHGSPQTIIKEGNTVMSRKPPPAQKQPLVSIKKPKTQVKE